jgi:hypothetical protein
LPGARALQSLTRAISKPAGTPPHIITWQPHGVATRRDLSPAPMTRAEARAYGHAPLTRQKVGEREARILNYGLWIMDYGLWIVDCGLWIVDCGLWIVDGRGGEEDGLKVEGRRSKVGKLKGRRGSRGAAEEDGGREARIRNFELWILDEASFLTWRSLMASWRLISFFGASVFREIKNPKSNIKNQPPRGLRCFGKKRSAQVIRSGDLTVASFFIYPAQEGTIRSLLLIPPAAPSEVERRERLARRRGL